MIQGLIFPLSEKPSLGIEFFYIFFLDPLFKTELSHQSLKMVFCLVFVRHGQWASDAAFGTCPEFYIIDVLE